MIFQTMSLETVSHNPKIWALMAECQEQETRRSRQETMQMQAVMAKLTRRDFLKLAAVSMASFPRGAMASERKPNVLFIAVDDMNDWVSYLGGYAGRVHTPNLERLAKRGVSFTNAHS
ncbi:MAG: sulfatase-like hydrolase/transferase, partial [Phycisphaerales bacterium]